MARGFSDHPPPPEGEGLSRLDRSEQHWRGSPGHGPGNPVASRRSHGVPPPAIVMAAYRRPRCTRRKRQASAPERGLALTRVPVHLPARRAPLARVMRLDLLHPAGRLVRQPTHQQPPARTQDAPVQPGLGPDVPGRVSRVPLDDRLCYRSSGPRHGSPGTAGRDPWRPSRPSLLAPVGLAGPQPGDRVPDPAAAVRAPRRAGEPALQAPQPDPLPRGQAGAV